jgi:hypothetical protein
MLEAIFPRNPRFQDRPNTTRFHDEPLFRHPLVGLPRERKMLRAETRLGTEETVGVVS